MIGIPATVQGIRQAAATSGIAPGPREIFQAETSAAHDSIASQLYVIFKPNPYAHLGACASEDVRNGTGQCCRIGVLSVCSCGHQLKDHQPAKIPKSGGYIKPPGCKSCRGCRGFAYVPFRPEECGQWWLPRRRDFNLKEWQQVLQQ